ncbi:MAG: NAD-dependent epimerase/dehydratase family protein [Candidatus Eisenbacteria bacterium]|nr:NAD-dependent epimerase/dehydratase family protein [Candidatus Eisenbacteria bacterium]
MPGKALVTGVAGFIGSHLAEKLLDKGFDVNGVDCFTPAYARELKERNLSGLSSSPRFTFLEDNLLTANLDKLCKDVRYVFHLAAQAGVRSSWGSQFEIYTSLNVNLTQRLLEYFKGRSIVSFVYASSSSVYGEAKTLPVTEDSERRPLSPYGVTKLAGENLCTLYWQNFRVPCVSLRYFTVYGPRQRPDMALSKFIQAVLDDRGIQIYGDGNQSRDFTYVEDAVEGTFSAMTGELSGKIFNIAGGSRTTVNECIGIIEKELGRKARVSYIASEKGDPVHTMADTTLARTVLGFSPCTKIGDGLVRQTGWAKENFRRER